MCVLYFLFFFSLVWSETAVSASVYTSLQRRKNETHVVRMAPGLGVGQRCESVLQTQTASVHTFNTIGMKTEKVFFFLSPDLFSCTCTQDDPHAASNTNIPHARNVFSYFKQKDELKKKQTIMTSCTSHIHTCIAFILLIIIIIRRIIITHTVGKKLNKICMVMEIPGRHRLIPAPALSPSPHFFFSF